MALDDLYGKILAVGADVIREQTYLPALVNHVTNEDKTLARSKGGIVEVIVPPDFVTRDVVPASTPPASQGEPAPSTVQVALDNFKEVNIPLTEKQITQLEAADPMAIMFIQNAVGPIIEDITAAIAATYKGIYGYVGTAGTTPFASNPADAQNTKKVLTRQKCPKMMRSMVLNTDAYANAIGLEAFRSYLQFGSDSTVRYGEVDMAYGFRFHEDVGMDGISHTTGGGAGWLVNQADHAVADTTVVIDTGSGDPVVGDIFTVAGDTQTYVVSGYASNTITYAPAAKVAWANNAAITFKASHAINLAFNPFAFAFDSRPHARLRLPGVTSNYMTWVDDMTGVTLRLEIRDEYHQTGIYLSCLFGAELVDPRLACRIAG
ncbi:MAG: hypothetical protein AAFN08_06760 [Cyanobacteria bacterium J06559_3]